MTGSFNDLADFNPGPEEDLRTDSGLTDIFIMQFLANGRYDWCHTFGGRDYDRAMAIAVDNLDNLYITGYFMDVVDFDPTNDTDKKRVSGTLDMFLSKFTTSGEYGWTKTFGGKGKDSGEALAVDSYGDIYVLGDRSRLFRRRDIFLAKISSEGKVLWKATVGGKDYDLGEGIAIDKGQSLYILGQFGKAVDFDLTANEDLKYVISQARFGGGCLEKYRLTATRWAATLREGRFLPPHPGRYMACTDKR
ncbi:MAG: hypothetical protein GY799_11705 [Desulfobulbaceae bacterium]|nr:hypothetical protein [Desulfobulbaceae bacterium]